MEKGKNNTVMLTVIAIATLLVAVVGATFAYFSANTEGNTAKVTVDTRTAAANDVFTATGSGALELEVTNDKMLQANGKDDYTAAITATDNHMKVSLIAGSGTATCTYKITYTAETGEEYDTYAKSANAGALLEYTIKGTDGTQTLAETNIDSATTFGPYTITDTFDTTDPETGATTQTWAFTANFYNLAKDQGAQIDKTFSGSLAVTDVSCTNSAN